MNSDAVGRSRTFRARLMVTMMLVIVMITAAVLYFAQRNAEADVARNLQREFQAEFAALLDVQEAHRAATADRCRALAKSVRIRAALEESDIEDLYLNTAVELRDLIGGDREEGHSRAMFYRFLDSTGAVMSPRSEQEAPEPWELQLAMPALPTEQQVGYIIGENDAICEVIATPIVSTDTGEVISTIVLGFTPGDLESGNVANGIFVDGRLHPPALSVLSREVAQASAAASGETAAPMTVQFRQVPHLLFCKALNPHSQFPRAFKVCLYPLADSIARQQRLRWNILGSGFLVLLAGVVASHFIAGRLSVPVERLAADSETQRAQRERAEAALEMSSDELRAMNDELQKVLANLETTQQQIIQQERLRALGQMASGIAHDFNNALVPILGFCELLLLSPQILDDKRKAATYLETIQTAAKDAASVVSRLREFYRQGKGDRPFAPVNLKRLVEQSITLTRPKWKDQAQANGATVEVNLELNAVPSISGDESALREVLTNLIFNAVDAMPEGGTLTLRTFRRDDSAVLEVIDNGTGMTEEVRQHCLEPFFSTKGECGTGLGLSMVFGIVQRHSGSLDIRSERGKGTTFVITFPLQEAAHSAGVATALSRTANPLRVLVVDDEAPVRDTLAAILTTDGHEVEMAADGLAGLKRFIAGKFDLVIADKAMPTMNGDQMASAIKRVAPKTPIILLTGFGLFHEKDEFPDIDVLASKPIRIPALREAVAAAVSQS